ncbi:MAG: hypothetical protein JSW51_00240 [Gemmatimonadota bacterium]|nr:MAG: hypothetical protein JSW51_00240 [Gemmatimonadota bacterium]
MPSRHTQSAPPSSRSRHAAKCISAAWFAAIALAVLVACDTPGVTLVDPDVANPDPDKGTTIHVTLEDSALAAALGWSQGVPNAEVRLNRIGDEFDPLTLLTDSTGTAVHETTLPGQYRLAAYRGLEQEEAGPTGGTARAFGDGGKVWLHPPQLVELALSTDQAGSLVVSEIQMYGRFEPGAPYSDYRWFEYFELYNNSDSTLYLDGMIWGRAFDIDADYTNTAYPCAVTLPWRTDSSGVWTMWIHQFPGTGSQYPVLPGKAVVVAMDAVDHSVIHPNLPDLTHADFELEGNSDPDNPDVPNLKEVGTRISWTGHGLQLKGGVPWFIALSIDVGSLESRHDSWAQGEWLKIPSDHIVDMVMFSGWTPATDQIAPYCDQYVHRDLDRLEARTGYYVPLTLQRKPLDAIGGLLRLQDLNVSYLDFHEATRTPGWVRQPDGGF